MTDTAPPADQQLRDRIAEAIRPQMLIGLQDAELYDGPGTERINEWADSIANWAAEAVQPELDRLHAELDAVRGLHKPVGRGALTICDECSPARSDGVSRYVLVPWPCDTARALDAASVSAPTT